MEYSSEEQAKLTKMENIKKKIEEYKYNIEFEEDMYKKAIKKITSVQSITQDIAQLQATKQGLQNTLNEIQYTAQKRIIESNSITANIDKNIELQHTSQILSTHLQKLASLKQQIQPLTLNDSSYQSILLAKEQLNKETHTMLGIIQSEEQQISLLKSETLQNKFVDIEKNIKKIEFKIALDKKMISDIQDHHDAVEKALMIVHKQKMEEINKELKELWRSTYKGKDIDSIQILSDTEKVTKGHTFNYRVGLVTPSGKELEMKGRCSAGQKMLATIIIRLALASIFCSRCGILALDEPTTNLDSDNIEGLANALVDIVKSHSNDNSLQLLIISHDEQFVTKLGSEFGEFIWNISKDEVTKQSKIRKLAIKKN